MRQRNRPRGPKKEDSFPVRKLNKETILHVTCGTKEPSPWTNLGRKNRPRGPTWAERTVPVDHDVYLPPLFNLDNNCDGLQCGCLVICLPCCLDTHFDLIFSFLQPSLYCHFPTRFAYGDLLIAFDLLIG